MTEQSVSDQRPQGYHKISTFVQRLAITKHIITHTMAVSFNEQANRYISNELSFQERKHLWFSVRQATINQSSRKTFRISSNDLRAIPLNFSLFQKLKQSSKARTVNKSISPPTLRKCTRVTPTSRNGVHELSCERRRKIRSFVRSVVDEHISLRAMGVNDAISLFRMSTACSKTDVTNAQLRASRHNPPQPYFLPSPTLRCCWMWYYQTVRPSLPTFTSMYISVRYYREN